MKLRRSIQHLHGPIDAAPMVNVILLLLIFFLLTSSFVFQPGIKIDLPKGPSMGGVNTRYIIAIADQNPPLIFFNDQVVTMESLDKQLRAIARSENNAAVILRADKNVRHETVVQVMNLAMNDGLSVVIATQPGNAAHQ